VEEDEQTEKVEAMPEIPSGQDKEDFEE